jgi:hypothetical protein
MSRMNSNDRRKLKRYDMVVYGVLLAFSVMFALIGNMIPQGTVNSMMINFASDLLSVAVLFFVIDKVFLLGDDGAANKTLEEVKAIKDSINKQLEQAKKHQQQKISVVLQNGGKTLELPVELYRSEFTRAEILGRVGMIPCKVKGQRFSLEYFSKKEFLNQINQIASNDGDAAFTIPCNDSEFSQFDLNS